MFLDRQGFDIYERRLLASLFKSKIVWTYQETQYTEIKAVTEDNLKGNYIVAKIHGDDYTIHIKKAYKYKLKTKVLMFNAGIIVNSAIIVDTYSEKLDETVQRMWIRFYKIYQNITNAINADTLKASFSNDTLLSASNENVFSSTSINTSEITSTSS